MRIDASYVVTSFVPAVALHLLIALGLWWWSRWLLRAAEPARELPWRHAHWLPPLGLALALTGIGLSAYHLVGASQAVESADAASKASLLSEHLARAMNATALFAIPGWGVDLACLVMCGAGSFERWRRRKK